MTEPDETGIQRTIAHFRLPPAEELLARMLTAEARAHRLRDLLWQIEWGGAFGATCQFCGADISDGHAPGCELAAALAEEA